MPTLFYCHDCDKVTANISVLCDSCQKKRKEKKRSSK